MNDCGKCRFQARIMDAEIAYLQISGLTQQSVLADSLIRMKTHMENLCNKLSERDDYEDFEGEGPGF
jgi:hypothetical protein